MNTTINDRIKDIADRLCGGNVSKLARVAGISQPALRDIVTGKKVKPGFDILNKIADNSSLNINNEWLMTGKGVMQNRAIDFLHRAHYNELAGLRPIPIYDINAAANLQTIFTNDSQHLLGEITIPNAPDCDGSIYVRGDSMYPLVKSGDMVSFKQLHNIENLVSGAMYVVDFQIDGDDFLVIKYVKWEERNSTLRLVSYNDHHQDMIVPANAVRAIALIKIVIRINSMF